ncbi:hypothetical protein DV704_07770 [Meiothermus sp. QL-1]|uniref:hypothetical protein n=1 Tax=Meiothermus sp. QL-1 TaxID=2058095 RepID=UPI000E0C64DE|nr:hypothetical protein [Meiothermus sp. QL-1]RDI95201.1 hypothetical protein DV704_07770 [Meiothermus sp. QL-1]
MRSRTPHLLLVLFLAGLVGLVSSQYALRDPRTQALPILSPGALCTAKPAPHGSSNPAPAHPQPHCPLCIVGGFSDGPPPPPILPGPSPKPLGVVPQEGDRPHLSPVFPLLNRGPPWLG